MVGFFDGFQLAAVACLLLLGAGRGLALYARGVRVVVVDRQRSLPRALLDLFTVLLFLLWAYEVVAYAWPLQGPLAPSLLGTMVTDAVAIKGVGCALVLAGLLIYGLALRAFGDSWRLGIDREAAGRLVTDGAFAWTRNPVYVSLDLVVAGTFLVQGRLISLVLALVIAALLHDQIRREERFLADNHGEAYRDYCASVGRYVTWPRRARGG